MNKSLPTKDRPEERAFSIPDLKTAEAGNVIQGHAAVFGQTTVIMGLWKESIARGAFDKTDFTDVVFSVNHDLKKIPLARTRSKTLQLGVDPIGLGVQADLDVERNTEAKALYGSIERGDLDGMSFIFQVKEDQWDDLDTEIPTRTILDIAKVYEVSAVSFPAYAGTDIAARDAAALESAQRTLESVRAAKLGSLQGQPDLELEKLRTEILSKG